MYVLFMYRIFHVPYCIWYIHVLSTFHVPYFLCTFFSCTVLYLIYTCTQYFSCTVLFMYRIFHVPYLIWWTTIRHKPNNIFISSDKIIRQVHGVCLLTYKLPIRVTNCWIRSVKKRCETYHVLQGYQQLTSSKKMWWLI